ncbi:hypothetical protein CHS0354_015715 [Potamilus streckersoni]|uniref:Acyl-coenzyme A thioesterase 13 n=1 Tax=Potamilus streckersoni TaxID=2493646 RepID=A0AAE0TIY7_9BIVA|nr:hypothetical protein CHS0354_015715 [Potamilus streckersoni]
MSATARFSLLKQIAERCTKNSGFESILKQIRVVSSGNGTCTCEMTVTEEHQNRGGTLHGGCTATLVDAVSTWVLMATDENIAGVSVNMDISKQLPGKIPVQISSTRTNSEQEV